MVVDLLVVVVVAAGADDGYYAACMAQLVYNTQGPIDDPAASWCEY
jgi:hypothetical protein